MMRAKSPGNPEQATISALVDTTERSRAREPSSSVSSEEGSPFQQTKTRQSSSTFQNSRDLKPLAPLSSSSRAKHCSVATCSAMTFMAQLKKCLEMA